MPGGCVGASSAAAACALVATSSASARPRPRRAGRRCRATRPLELFVRNTTRSPASRRRVDTRPPRRRSGSPRATPRRPGRSTRPDGRRPRRSLGSRPVGLRRPSARVDDLLERGPVVGVVGPHDRRQAQVPAGPGPVAGLQPAEPDAVLRVVVDRLDVERGDELLLRGGEPAGAEVRARQRLADRALAGSSSRACSSAITAACALPSRAAACPRRRRCMRRSGLMLTCGSPPWRFSGSACGTTETHSRASPEPGAPTWPTSRPSPVSGTRARPPSSRRSSLHPTTSSTTTSARRSRPPTSTTRSA